MKSILIVFMLIILSSCHWTTNEDNGKEGTTEKIQMFLWYPKNCLDNKTYWLQYITVDRIYRLGFWGVDHYDFCTKG